MRAKSDESFESLLFRAAEFHGHLGPYLVIGLRMGLLAKALLGANGMNGLSAALETGQKPPLSCVADGVQVSTLCTLGKGNIRIRDSGRAKGRFEANGMAVEIELKGQVESMIKELLQRGFSERAVEEIKALSDLDLFEIREMPKGGGVAFIHAGTHNR
ncbi:MAG: formylmethanofuran dehydrogenase subunit E family protein [Candidatus Bathyarchaeia archaeon]